MPFNLRGISPQNAETGAWSRLVRKLNLGKAWIEVRVITLVIGETRPGQKTLRMSPLSGSLRVI